MVHLDNCLRIGHEAQARKLNATLALVYDDVCRQQWASMARSGVSGFSVDIASLAIDSNLLARAEILVLAKDKRSQNNARVSVRAREFVILCLDSL